MLLDPVAFSRTVFGLRVPKQCSRQRGVTTRISDPQIKSGFRRFEKKKKDKKKVRTVPKTPIPIPSLTQIPIPIPNRSPNPNPNRSFNPNPTNPNPRPTLTAGFRLKLFLDSVVFFKPPASRRFLEHVPFPNPSNPNPIPMILLRSPA